MQIIRLKQLLLILFFLGAMSSFAVAEDSSAEKVPSEISEIFSKSLYKDALWGLRVVDTESGKVLIDLETTHPFYIGSVRKVFSVGLLLNEIGAAHTYDTPVYRQGTVDGNGVLNGSLVVVASGDLTMGGRTKADGTLDVTGMDHNEANSLGAAELSKPDPLDGYRELARQVAQSGVTRVTGDVVIDDRLFQPFLFRDEFKVTPIFVNDDVVDVNFSPTETGRLAQTEYRPKSEALSVSSRVSTGAAGSELELEVEPELPRDIGTPGAEAVATGVLPIDFQPPFNTKLPLVRTVRITSPSNYARTVFVEALEDEGVEVDAETVKLNPTELLPEKDSYRMSEQVALLTGSPYGEVARFILKVSYNIGADTSLVLLGLTQGVDNMSAALEKEKAILASEYGLDPSTFHFVDGSGGGESTATNETVTSMLIGLLNSPQREVLMKALPTLAVDGSLGFVTDFKKDPSLSGAAGNVHAKTGTYVGPGPSGMVVKGQGFGGYVKTRGGRTLAYHLTVNGVPISTIEDLTQIFQDQGTISALLWRDY